MEKSYKSLAFFPNFRYTKVIHARRKDFLMDNICRFIPLYSTQDTIHIINFVQETKSALLRYPEPGAAYKLYYVTSGTGTLLIDNQKTELSEGDIFVVYPGKTFCVENGENFVCIYISYLGMRANMIMERLGITGKKHYFPYFPELRSFWETALHTGEAAPDLISESVLLYTFAALADRLRAENGEKELGGAAEMVRRIKGYIDENFSDPALTLESVAKRFSYNKKYLSSAFKKQMKTGFSSYLNIVRCRHACRLMDQNFTSTQDIAHLCGYNDPLYFSKVFHQKMGISPRDYRQNLKKETK